MVERGPLRQARASPAATSVFRHMIVTAGQPVSFFGGRLPSWVDVRVFAVAPGEERVYRAAEWRNALVVVERGQIELRCVNGTSWHFERGATLVLAGLPIRALRNDGIETTLIAALSRAGNRTRTPASGHPSRARGARRSERRDGEH
jgi:hypothetical protein